MNVNLRKYANLKICVAVSGGRDSMALLHCLHAHAAEYGITLTALNCDHGMRPTSAGESAFVADHCREIGVPLSRYAADRELAGEGEARAWRLACYLKEAERCDCVATAHHLNDNAETVLFNLARGAALKGMEGITDRDLSALAGRPFGLIRPLIACTRAEIDEYVAANGVPYVDDETNFGTDCTRNRIRHCVLPELESAVPGAAGAIFRFSRLAAEDEAYLEGQAASLLSGGEATGFCIAHCEEKVLFRRAAVQILAGRCRKKDYTSEQLERLYELQFARNGKKFEFLGLTAFREEGRLRILAERDREDGEAPYEDFARRLAGSYGGQIVCLCPERELEGELERLRKLSSELPLKALKFDGGRIPQGAVVRFVRAGDRFTKFGGGTKNLGDWFTDRKIPAGLRPIIPLLCDGREVLIVFGLEISDKVRVDGGTEAVCCALACDYSRL